MFVGLNEAQHEPHRLVPPLTSGSLGPDCYRGRIDALAAISVEISCGLRDRDGILNPSSRKLTFPAGTRQGGTLDAIFFLDYSAQTVNSLFLGEKG
jgi:hypothetical protein